MSHRMTHLAVERLLTDERLRIRFLRSRIEALTDLARLGIDLTPDEIAMFIQTDARVWFCETAGAGDRVH
jgi:hypothetical protein